MASNLSENHRQTTLASGIVIHKWPIDSPSAIVILQHGFGEYAERYVASHARLIPRLNAVGFDVWAMDLEGHGRSPGNGCMLNLEVAVQDHIHMRHLAATQGKPIFLLGHSLGGLITAISTIREPSGICGVVLSSPAFPAQDTSLVVEGALGLLAWIAPRSSLPKARTPASQLVHGADQAQLIENDTMLLKSQISYSTTVSALRLSRELWNGSNQWRLPSLVIHGTDDVAIRYETSRVFLDMIVSKDKTLHLDEGGYHELLCDTHAEEIAKLITQWLIAHL